MYYKSEDNVIFPFDPMIRILINIGFPKKWFIHKCKTCDKIPTEVYRDEKCNSFCKLHRK